MEDVRKIADGRIIMGEKAVELKLVDQLGNFEDAVAKAGELGKIQGEPEVEKAKKSKHSLLDLLIGGDVSEKLTGLLDDSSACSEIRTSGIHTLRNRGEKVLQSLNSSAAKVLSCCSRPGCPRKG